VTREESRQAVLRRLDRFEAFPEDLDDFLDVPRGTTEQVKREQEPTPNGEGDACGRVD
jgi:hypothetical protein